MAGSYLDYYILEICTQAFRETAGDAFEGGNIIGISPIWKERAEIGTEDSQDMETATQ